jgi:flagellar L-ring protein precursor FlgH
MTMRGILAAAALAACTQPAWAENLYRNSGFPAMSSDRRASVAGDLVMIVVFQAAEAVNSTRSTSRRTSEVSGRIGGGGFEEGGELSFGGGFTGQGEVRRSERVVAQITVTVREVLPNGDFLVEGEQFLFVNGERTRIGVRGRIRQADIGGDNVVLSSRIADAQIDYAGRGFVSRSARPGFVNRVFRFLGLG